MAPETRYVKTSDGVHIAYQVYGDGPVDLAFVMGWMTNIEAMWEEPAFAHMLTRLGSFARVFVFDKRGCGLSDRVSVSSLPSLETRMDDLRAVLDAVGSERAVLYGVSEGGPMAMLFAATYPARTLGLIVYGSGWSWIPQSPEQWARHENAVAEMEASWGTEEYARMAFREWAAPSVADDARAVRWFASYLRRAASPGSAVAYTRMNALIDVADILPAIRVPTLVVARVEDSAWPLEYQRELAKRIPRRPHRGAAGRGSRALGRRSGLSPRRARTVRPRNPRRRGRARPDTGDHSLHGHRRVHQRAAELGDRAWTELVAQHHGLVRAHLARFRGREIDTAGDGFFATFDGPIRAARCALAISESVRELGLEIRAGLHTGEVEVSDGSVRGIALVVGARVGALAGPSEVLATSTVHDLVAGSTLVFDEHGEHDLKGVPGTWRVFRVSSAS